MSPPTTRQISRDFRDGAGRPVPNYHPGLSLLRINAVAKQSGHGAANHASWPPQMGLWRDIDGEYARHRTSERG